MRTFQFLCRRSLSGLGGWCSLEAQAVYTRATRQMDAERGQGEGLPASVVRHGEAVSCVGGQRGGCCRRWTAV